MKISTRGRYALRIMVDLAEHNSGEYIPLKDVVDRQEISQKYAESIMATLSKGGLVQAERGKSGGYRLSRVPESYTVREILALTEGSLHPVACVAGAECPRSKQCRTVAMWTKLDAMIEGFFDGIHLNDLVDFDEEWTDYVI